MTENLSYGGDFSKGPHVGEVIRECNHDPNNADCHLHSVV